jgi:hypothetical protein
MANLVAYLNARPISTRFHIRVATVRAVQVMREPTGINLPEGGRRASTVKLAHLTVFGCLRIRCPRLWADPPSDVGALAPVRARRRGDRNR